MTDPPAQDMVPHQVEERTSFFTEVHIRPSAARFSILALPTQHMSSGIDSAPNAVRALGALRSAPTPTHPPQGPGPQPPPTKKRNWDLF